MAKTVRLPNGEKVVVNAPDDADDEEVLEFVESKVLEQERAKERKSLVDMIEAQQSGIELLRKDVMNMAKLVVKLTERINHIDQRKMPEPVVHVAAPSVQVAAPSVKVAAPEVRVMADPGMAVAMKEMHRSHEETMKAVVAALGKISMMPAPEHHEEKAAAYNVEFETDQHSPRYGRIKRVVPVIQ